MLAGLLALTILTMTLFPETEVGRWLHLHLVDQPLRLAGRMERKQVFLVVILLLCGQHLVMLGGIDMALIYAAHLSVYADALLLTYAAAVATRYGMARTAFRLLAARLARRLPRPRARSRRTRASFRRTRKPANEDRPGWHPGRAFPAAA